MDFLGLKRKSQELAKFYKQHVLKSSFYNAMRAVSLDEAEIEIDGWKQLIDITGNGKTIELISDYIDKIHFAKDGNGIFAVIRDMRLYSIKRTKRDDNNLKDAQKYDLYARSVLRRALYAFDILWEYHVVYYLREPIYGIKDDLSLLSLNSMLLVKGIESLRTDLVNIRKELGNFRITFEEHLEETKKLMEETLD